MAAIAVLPPQDCLHLRLQTRHRQQCFGSAFYPSHQNHQNRSHKVLHHSKLSDAFSMADTRRKAPQSYYFCPRNSLKKAPFSDRKSPKKQRKQISGCLETKQRFSGVVRILQRPETEEAAKTLLSQFEWKGQENVSSPETDMGPYSADTSLSVEVDSLQMPETEEAAMTLLSQFDWNGQQTVSCPETDMGPYSADTSSSVEVESLQRPETEEATKTLLSQFDWNDWNGQQTVSSPETDMGPYSADTSSSVEVDLRSKQSVPCDAIGCSEEDEVPKFPPLPSKKLLERWAGPGYSNSPPPTCLPVPNFLSMKSRSLQLSDLHLMHKKRMLAPESRHLNQDNVIVPCGYFQFQTSDVSFVTRDLRRILNLDCIS